jgi:hypothetical protein
VEISSGVVRLFLRARERPGGGVQTWIVRSVAGANSTRRRESSGVIDKAQPQLLCIALNVPRCTLHVPCQHTLGTCAAIPLALINHCTIFVARFSLICKDNEFFPVLYGWSERAARVVVNAQSASRSTQTSRLLGFVGAVCLSKACNSMHIVYAQLELLEFECNLQRNQHTS